MGQVFSAAVQSKINRSCEHATALSQTVTDWFANSTELKFDPTDGRHITLDLVVKEPPDLDQWACIFGDSIHTMRSALDIWMWERVTAELGGEPDSNRVYFPIYETRSSFKNWVKDMRALGVSKETIEALRKLQPYEQEFPVRQSALFAIHRLDIDDKHMKTAAIGFSHYGVDPLQFSGRWRPVANSDYDITVFEADIVKGGRLIEIVSSQPLELAQPAVQIKPTLHFVLDGEQREMLDTLGDFLEHVQKKMRSLDLIADRDGIPR